MTLGPRHPPIVKTATELRAQARDYRQRGLIALAETCEKQARAVELRAKREGVKR
jgi:hypothetical protein